MAWSTPPVNVIERVFVYLGPQDVAFRMCLLNHSWYRHSLANLYKVIPPFASASQLSRACQTIISHPEQVARHVLEISVVHTMKDISDHTTLYYTVRAALALCSNLKILYLHTDPAVARITLGACTFRLKIFSVIDPSEDLATVFLSHQESLEELVIVRGADVPLYLPKDALPSLVRFSGIPENAIRISQGRRLKTLRLLPGPTLLNLSDTLSRIDSLTMSSLCELHVLVTGSVLDHVIILAQFLPHLTALVVRYYQHDVLFEALGAPLSGFVNLSKCSLLSLNAPAQTTPTTLNSEYSIVMLYYQQCPTLRAIILRSISWVHADQSWCPQDDSCLKKIWEETGKMELVSAKEAERALHLSVGGLNEGSSGEYATMDSDSTSEISDYGDQVTACHLAAEA